MNRPAPRPGPQRVTLLPRAGDGFCEYRLDVPVVRADLDDVAVVSVLGEVLLTDARRPDAAAVHDWATDAVATATVQTRPDRLSVTGCAAAGSLVDVVSRAVGALVAPAPPAAAVRAAADRLAGTARAAAAHPALRVRRAELQARWGPHPAVQEVADPDRLAAVDAAAVAAFTGLRPESAVLTLCGDLAAVPGAVPGARLADLLPGPAAAPAAPGDRPAPRWRAGDHLVDTGADPLTRLRWAWPAPDRSHPDYPALHVLSLVLGGYSGSRLLQRLRERDGAVYGVQAGFESSRTTSALTLSVDTPHARAGAVLAAVEEELDDLLLRGPGPREVEAAVTYALNSTTVALAAPAAHAAAVAGLALAGLTPDWWDRYADAARALTPDRVRAVAAAVLGGPRVHVRGGPAPSSSLRRRRRFARGTDPAPDPAP